MASFPTAQLLIIDGGEFFSEPERTYRDVLGFLGLSEHSLKIYSTLNAHRYEPMPPEHVRSSRKRSKNRTVR